MLNIKIDSRKVTKGDTFVAIVGLNTDGHNFINDAINNGATKIIVSKDVNINEKVEKVLVKDTTEYLHNYLLSNYADKINSIDLIGVTGTNGKTTTCFLVYQLLKSLNKKVAYIGTVGYYFQDEFKKLDNTTPNIIELYDLILESINKGCDTVIMEVSSHALSQNRIDGLKFKTAAFTNFTQDHLNYHKTMENYLNAKLKILNYLNDDSIMIANIDDEVGEKFRYKNFKTISFNNADFKIINYLDKDFKTEIEFTYLNKNYKCIVNLKSKFNVYNFITAIAIVNSLGFNINDILKKSLEITAPKGRCEQIKINDGIAVVDYAHTPDAVLKIINAFNENKKGKIITIVGCGGDRDPQKRPQMGKIATDYSDYVIFTNDNPRTEDENKIIDDIIMGVEKKNYEIVLDRKKAIEKGITMIKKNDVLLVLGKGHEDYQIIGNTKYHFDDMEIIKNFI